MQALHLKVALALKLDLKKCKGATLAPVRDLCTSYGASYLVILKALHVLESEGLIIMHQGRRTQIVNKQQKNPTQDISTETAVSIIVKGITQQIAAGELRAGDLVPKFENLCSGYSCSTTTLKQALTILEHKQLVHQSGRQRIVGPAPAKSKDGGFLTKRKTILLAVNHETEWEEFHGSYLEPFAMAFFREAERLGIRIVQVVLDANSSSHVFVTGVQEVRQFIARLGHDYLGSLLVPPLSQIVELAKWLKILCAQQKPVALMQDDLPELSFAGSIRRLRFVGWGTQGKESHYFLALDHLANLGHRIIALVCNRTEDQKWFRQRAERLQRNAKEFFPDLTITVIEDYGTGARADQDTVFLKKILKMNKFSALLAPNDVAAKGFYRALRQLGRRVPEDISLLSWDNRPDLMPYPISSIDFGLDELAYRTVHLLLGVLPVKVGRSKTLYAKNSVALRGSTALCHVNGLANQTQGKSR